MRKSVVRHMYMLAAGKRRYKPMSMDEIESTSLAISPIERFDMRLAAHIW